MDIEGIGSPSGAIFDFSARIEISGGGPADRAALARVWPLFEREMAAVLDALCDLGSAPPAAAQPADAGRGFTAFERVAHDGAGTVDGDRASTRLVRWAPSVRSAAEDA